MNIRLASILQSIAALVLLRPSSACDGYPPPESSSSHNVTSDIDADPTGCLEEVIFYQEMIDEDEMVFDEDTKQFAIVDKPLFEDQDLLKPVVKSSCICNALDDTRFLCSVVAVDDIGTMTLTGISEVGADASTYVITGGTDGYAGLVGKATSQYDPEADVVVVKVCRQE